MKQQLKADKEQRIKTPAPRRSDERLFAETFETMIDLMAKTYRKEVIEWMSQGTVNKFSDDGEQIGNFATVFTKQAKKIKRSLLQVFSNKVIERLVRERLTRVNEHNRAEIYKKIEKVMGISSAQLIAQEGLNANTNALIIETYMWALGLRDKALQSFTTNTLQEMAQGGSLENLLSRFDETVKKERHNANFLARNQIQNFNSVSTKIRAQNLGISEGIWRTSKDERVRTSHQRREGKRFTLSKGLNGTDNKKFIPGTDFNCRCTVELIIPKAE